MIYIGLIKQLLRQEEGVKHELYLDTAGYWTYGVGHLVDHSKIAAFAWLNSELTKHGTYEAVTEYWFNKDLETHLKIAQDICPNFNDIGPARQCVIASLAWQFGGKLYGYEQTRRLIKANDWLELSDLLTTYRDYKKVRGIRRRFNRARVLLLIGCDARPYTVQVLISELHRII